MIAKLFGKPVQHKPVTKKFKTMKQILHIHLTDTHTTLEYPLVIDDRFGLMSAFDHFCDIRVKSIGKNGFTVGDVYYPPHRIKHIVLGEKTVSEKETRA